jgi:hypothetical protein
VHTIFCDPDLYAIIAIIVSSLQAKSSGRLPGSLVPSEYNLVLQIQVHSGGPPFLFSGQAEVHFTCIEATNQVVLNTKRLDVDLESIRVRTESGQDLEVDQIILDEELEFLIIQLMQPLEQGQSYVAEILSSGAAAMFYEGGLVLVSYQEANQTEYRPII